MTFEEAKAAGVVKAWIEWALSPVKLFEDKCNELGLDGTLECKGDGSVAFWIEFEGEKIRVDAFGTFEVDKD
jgi:hypothetical protein